MQLAVLGPDPHAWPDPRSADEEGVVAIGGDLKPERLEAAYRRGIFPWYSEGLPIIWHCPEPRFVLEPEHLHVPRSLAKLLKKGSYRVTCDTAFELVIEACARTRRPGQRGTWITRDMQKAYVRWHKLGIAHSCEAWLDGELKGGLYGVSLGDVFFGESMFARAPDASKVAFVTLVEWLRGRGVQLIDCQQQTAHLERFGAVAWSRDRFLARLAPLVEHPTRRGPWRLPEGNGDNPHAGKR